MNVKVLVPAAFCLCIGLLAVRLSVDATRNAQATLDARRSAAVVRAARDIDTNTEIRAEMVEVVRTSDYVLAPKAERISRVWDAVGRMTCKAVPKGSPILLSMLAPGGTKPDADVRVRPAGRTMAAVVSDGVSWASGDPDNGNGYTGLRDYYYFEFCFSDSGPGEKPYLGGCIESFDADRDGDVDLADFAAFEQARVQSLTPRCDRADNVITIGSSKR